MRICVIDERVRLPVSRLAQKKRAPGVESLRVTRQYGLPLLPTHLLQPKNGSSKIEMLRFRFPTLQHLIAIACGLTSVILACRHSIASETAENTHSDRQQFLSTNCLDCHQGDSSAAGLDLEQLGDPTSDSAAFETWVKVVDRVESGEMPPPEDYGALDPKEIMSFVEPVSRLLRKHQRSEFLQHGRVGTRRLTHLQLERTLQDLLSIDIPLAREIPAEPRNSVFDTLAEGQAISHFTLENYLKVIDLALDEAFRRSSSPEDNWVREMTAKEISRTRSRCREPEYIDEGAVVWSSRLAFYGRIPATVAKESGWYRFKFDVSALKKPDDQGVWCTIRSGQCVSSAPLMNTITTFEATDASKTISFETWLPAGHMLEIRPADVTLKGARFAGGQAANGEGGSQNVAGIKINGMTMARFHRNGDDESVRQSLVVDAFKGQSSPESIKRLGHEAIGKLAVRAFRRPTSEMVLSKYKQLFDDSIESGLRPMQALQAAYRAVLCSARFLYFNEAPGKLDSYAIASRLSYFLWNSMPDKALFDLAASDQLEDPEVIKTQVLRMLEESPRGGTFISDLANQWLDLDQVEANEPDRRRYPQFDIVVQHGMRDEVIYFLEELLAKDLSVSNFVSSDFTYLDGRLARYYGIADLAGQTFSGTKTQRIALEPNSYRGGLLGQGAILKVTANGTETSPVIRGVWVSERILGCEIPPPPSSVPAIEPDIRGATTIREQLAKHRESTECAACHTNIDPPGFALENFDATGRWREFYPKVERGKLVNGQPINASYVTSDGKAFADVVEFRDIYSEKTTDIAKGFAAHLIAYGTGREVTFSDRIELDQIIEAVAKQGLGMKSIIQSVAASEIFRNR